MSALERMASLAASATSPAALRGLAASEHPDVLRAVAGNPCTPADVLYRLVAPYPREALANPSFAIHLMADNLLRLPFLSALALTACPCAPPALLGLLAASRPWHFEDRPVFGWCGMAVAARAKELVGGWELNLAANPSTPAEALARLALSLDPEVRAAAAGHPSTPPALLALIRRAARQELLGSTGKLTEQERASLLDGGPFGRALVAARADTPAVVRERLVSLALEERSTATLLEREIAASERRSLAEALAHSIAATPEELRRLQPLLAGMPALARGGGREASGPLAAQQPALEVGGHVVPDRLP